MKNRYLLAGLAVLGMAFVARTALAAPEVAVLHGRNSSGTDFDDAVRKLGLEVDHYRCNDKEIRAFCAKAGRYSLVLVDSLFDYGRDGKSLLSADSTDPAAIRSFVEGGGVLVVADAVYGQVRSWLARVDGSLVLPKVGNCNSSQWAVLGHTVNVEPADPVRIFPNRITQGNSWPHFEKSVPSGWKVVANCSEGYPVTLTRRLGKGLVVASALRQPGEKLLENYVSAARLLKAGVSVKSFAQTPFALGPGRLTMELSDAVPEDTRLVMEFSDAHEKVTSFSASFTNAVASLDYDLGIRGKVTARLWVESDRAGRTLLFSRTAEMPRLLTVDPPAYRGVLSTKRRLPDVRFRVRIACVRESLGGATLTLDVFDALSNRVCTAKRTFSRDPKDPVPSDFDFSVALPKDLSAGAYEVRASLDRYGAKSAAPFEILAPRSAQTVIDEDKTFLVNGRPFFPLGIYHPGGDYDAIADIGFNMVQFWKWSVGDDGFGSPQGVNRALGRGLRLLFESNHFGEGVYRECAERLGGSDAMLMWYVGDEPAEGDEDRVRFINDCWHKYDRHHPTYLLSCREDLFGLHSTLGDVFAFDVYGEGKKDKWAPVPQTARWMAAATAATRDRKALVCVPWANPSPEVLRPTAYTALANDARGLIWYPWKQAGGGPVGIGLNTDKKCQEVMKELLAEIKGMLPGLLSPKRRVFREMDGKVNAMACGTDAKKRFLVMVNPTGEKVSAAFDVEELKKAKSVWAYPSGEEVEVRDGRVVHDFDPYGVLVYRW